LVFFEGEDNNASRRKISQMKKIGVAIITIGFLAIGLSMFADVFDSGNYKGVGATQILGIEIGVILVLIGFGLLVASWQGVQLSLKFTVIFRNILDSPTIVWISTAFLIVNLFFFVKPMFLNSKLQMDYFNRYIPNTGLIGADIRTIMTSIESWLVSGNSPYENGLLAYPPLVLILFSPLMLIGFPAYFKLLIYATLLSYIVVSLILPSFQNRNNQKSIIYLVFAMGLISYGLQFELERGQFNLIAFAICYLAIYLFHSYPKFRIFAYILFSISVQLKIFTGIFILLFIDKWLDWKVNVRRIVGIGLLNLLLFFILGVNTLKEFLAAISINQFDLTPWNGVSIQSFVFRLSRRGYGVFSEEIMMFAANNSELLEWLFLLLYGLCLIIQIAYAVKQSQHGFDPYLFVTCTIGALIIPTISNDYKLPLLIGPMAILLSSLSIRGSFTKKILSIILIITISSAFWSTLYPFEVKPEIMHNNLLVLFLILISITVFRMMASTHNADRNIV
jgi:hypothetical protein